MRRYPFTVAKDESGKTVGFAYLDAFNTKSAYRCTADLTIYVDHRHLHDHIGSGLLSEIERLAVKSGITMLISIITYCNLNSRMFHERNGFVPEGTLHDVAVKFGEKKSICYYRKELKK